MMRPYLVIDPHDLNIMIQLQHYFRKLEKTHVDFISFHPPQFSNNSLLVIDTTRAFFSYKRFF